MQTSAQDKGWKTIVWASGRVDATPARNPTPKGGVVILTADHATTQAVILPLTRANTTGSYLELPAVADAPNQHAAMTALLNIRAQIKTTTSSRADRIHALFMRNARRFKEVAFAARLAFDRLEQLAPIHPDYRALSAVADRATASMATLNARSIRLARAEIATLTHREEACHVK